jgi:mRNA-degrading endonuclease toxin of MazEF toxin-antitoxin module
LLKGKIRLLPGTYNACSTKNIIELNYELPSGKFKAHPALVISNSNVLETEDIFYAVMISSNSMNEEFNFELSNAMLTKPLSKRSFVKCQLIQSYTTDEVISRISILKQADFDKVLKKIFETVF